MNVPFIEIPQHNLLFSTRTKQQLDTANYVVYHPPHYTPIR